MLLSGSICFLGGFGARTSFKAFFSSFQVIKIVDKNFKITMAKKQKKCIFVLY